jgi:hypothetical protein
MIKSFGKPFASISQEVFLSEALAEPAVAIVWQLHIAAHLNPSSFLFSREYLVELYTVRQSKL